MVVGSDGKKRCFGSEDIKSVMTVYHDKEWGVPVHDDSYLFEMLILEGVQAGLNWDMVLKKREGYRKAFHRFDPVKVAHMSDKELEALLQNPEIIRNRLKIGATRQNARVFLEIQKEFGSFDSYVLQFAPEKTKENKSGHIRDLPANTKESDVLSKDLKRRGMKFVGSTIVYSFMQAVGLVNDHIKGCWRYNA